MTTTSDTGAQFEAFAKYDPVGALAYTRALQKGHVPVHKEAFELVAEDSPVLRTPAEPVTELNEGVIDTALKLAETMLRGGGIGLAAPQVGLPIRMIAVRSNPLIVAINPVIIDVGNGTLTPANVEGCLSFPGLAVKVKRFQSIRVRYMRPNGEVVTENYAGLTATVFQHEIDHLDGILYYDRASRYHRDQAFRQRNRRG